MDITARMKTCEDLCGYFTINEGDEIVACIERRDATDPDWISEGIGTYYILHQQCGAPVILLDNDSLKEFLAKSSWSLTFHKKED